MPKAKKTGRRDDTLNLRVPRELKEALQRAAKEDDRSVSSMAVRLLREQLTRSGHLEKE
jgi:hypothetical protein